MVTDSDAGSAEGELLQELEALNHVLRRSASQRQQQQPPHSRRISNPRPIPTAPTAATTEKKTLWSWKPLRALAGIGSQQRVACEFSLRVHAVEGLPSRFEGHSVKVQWRRKEGGVHTRPSLVVHGVAEFEEVLYHKCSLKVSRAGPNHSTRYDSKFFEISVSVVDLTLELCKHRLDLSRMLPDSFHDTTPGSWSTNFKLNKEGRGGILVVTIGYAILQNPAPVSNNPKAPKIGPSNPKNAAPREMDGKVFRVSGSKGPLKAVESYNGVTHRRSQSSVADSRTQSSVANSRSFTNRQFLVDSDVSALFDFKPKLKFFDQENRDVNALDDGGNEAKGKGKQGDVLESNKDIFVDEEVGDFNVVEKGVELDNDMERGLDLDGNKSDDYAEVKEKMEVIVEENDNPEGEEQVKNKEEVLDEENDNQKIIESFEIKNTDNDCKSGEIFYAEDHCNEKFEHPSFEVDYVEKGLNVNDKDHKSVHTREEALVDKPVNLSTEIISFNEKVDLAKPVNMNTDIMSFEEEMNLACEQDVDLGGELGDLDDVADTVTGEFLSNLGMDSNTYFSSDSDPDSPRARLLKQFEAESTMQGFLGFGVEDEYDAEALYMSQQGWESDEDFALASMVEVAESELQKAVQAERSRCRAKILEGAETEALMQEWGLDEKVFQHSPPRDSDTLNSMLDMQLEDAARLPPLGEGFGPLVKTRDGGLLRTMNPSLFRNSKSKGSLVMQISNPMVVPAEMGSDIMDILRHLASVGIERLSAEVQKRMPIEDITGKTIQQVAAFDCHPIADAADTRPLFVESSMADSSSASASFEISAFQSLDSAGYNAAPSLSKAKSRHTYSAHNRHTEYVSLDELAPVAMDKLEALTVEGLKIQSDMGDVEAPSNVNSMSMGEVSVFQGIKSKISGTVGLEGTAGLQLLEPTGPTENIGGLLDMSITLDEWMKLDTGVVGEEETSERTAKILAAHHAIRSDLVVTEKYETDRSHKSKRRSNTGKWGFMGNTLTIALLIQLRDPQRNFEPVGAPMLALVQAERIVVPPKTKIWKEVSPTGNSEEVDEPEIDLNKSEEISSLPDEKVSQFKITQVHVAGLKTEEDNKKSTSWCNPKQEQAGSRWLVANGMGKNKKHPILKSKPMAKPSNTKAKPGNSLWSLSSRIFGDGERQKEVAAPDPHIRNPDVVLRNSSVRLR